MLLKHCSNGLSMCCMILVLHRGNIANVWCIEKMPCSQKIGRDALTLPAKLLESKAKSKMLV